MLKLCSSKPKKKGIALWIIHAFKVNKKMLEKLFIHCQIEGHITIL